VTIWVPVIFKLIILKLVYAGFALLGEMEGGGETNFIVALARSLAFVSLASKNVLHHES
jgi:hypothetical protein